MIAITAKGALLPLTYHDPFCEQPVPNAIKRGVKLKVLVLDPNCPEANFRSSIESGNDTEPMERLLQKDAHEVEKNLIRQYHQLLGLSEVDTKDRLKIGRTTIGIGFSLWLFSDVAFLVPHHFGKENERANLCHFSSIVIPSGNREYDLLDKHFNTLWDAEETKQLWD